MSYTANLITTGTNSTNYLYPEQYSGLTYGQTVPDVNGVGLALSGGGTQSMTTLTGFFRALNRMGYKNKEQYVSSVSGGSWFYGTYSNAQVNGYTDTQLLGYSTGSDISGQVNYTQIPSIQNINSSQAKLSTDNNNFPFIGYTYTNVDITYYIITNGINLLANPTQAYQKVVGQMFLKPYGLYNKIIALNSSQANIILKNNLNIKSSDIVVVPQGFPFWICNTTLSHNYAGIQYPYLVVPMTPLYSGLPYIYTEPSTNNTIGGYVLENFAFGASTNTPSGGVRQLNPIINNTVSVNQTTTNLSIQGPKYIQDMLGASSSAYAAILTNKAIMQSVGLVTVFIILDAAGINPQTIIPVYNIFGTLPKVPTNLDSQCNFVLGSCVAANGFSSSTCTESYGQCYTNTGAQCKYNNDCTYSIKNGCTNKNANESNLNCDISIGFTGIGCKCGADPNFNSPAVPDTKGPFTTAPSTVYSQTTNLIDGGFSDNSGVLSLVARGVKRVISFTSANEMNNLFSSVARLFGTASSQVCVTAKEALAGTSLQIFNTSDYTGDTTTLGYIGIAKQFANTYASGGPTFARASLRVLPNKLYGVAGNYTVDILFVLDVSSSTFNTQIASSISSQFTTSNSVINPVKYNNFPNFGVFFQNPSRGIIGFTPDQVNLLSTYTDWSLNQPSLQSNVFSIFGSTQINNPVLNTNNVTNSQVCMFSIANTTYANLFNGASTFGISSMTVGYTTPIGTLTQNIKCTVTITNIFTQTLTGNLVTGSNSYLQQVNIANVNSIPNKTNITLQFTSSTGSIPNLTNVFLIITPSNLPSIQVDNPGYVPPSNNTAANVQVIEWVILGLFVIGAIWLLVSFFM